MCGWEHGVESEVECFVPPQQSVVHFGQINDEACARVEGVCVVCIHTQAIAPLAHERASKNETMRVMQLLIHHVCDES